MFLVVWVSVWCTLVVVFLIYGIDQHIKIAKKQNAEFKEKKRIAHDAIVELKFMITNLTNEDYFWLKERGWKPDPQIQNQFEPKAYGIASFISDKPISPPGRGAASPRRVEKNMNKHGNSVTVIWNDNPEKIKQIQRSDDELQIYRRDMQEVHTKIEKLKKGIEEYEQHYPTKRGGYKYR